MNVDGDVWMKEVAGDMRIGLIRSRLHDVELTVADGSMLDADPADCPGGDRAACAGTDPADVAGVNITLYAKKGTIGTHLNFLEIDLVDSVATRGVLNAEALSGIYIDETGDLDPLALSDLRVEYVVSGPSAGAVSDVTLTTRQGSILDARAGTTPASAAQPFEIELPNVEARRIHLGATGGGIGQSGDDFAINSSNAGANSGNFFGFADLGIYVTETDDELSVLAATSLTGDVRLTIPDTASPRGPPTPDQTDPLFDAQPEDLILLVDGQSLIDQSTPLFAAPSTDATAETRAGIWAKGDISCGSATTSSHPPPPRSWPAARSRSTATSTGSASPGSTPRTPPPTTPTPTSARTCCSPA